MPYTPDWLVDSHRGCTRPVHSLATTITMLLMLTGHVPCGPALAPCPFAPLSRQLQRQVDQLQSQLQQTREQLAAEREASAAAAKAAEAAAACHRQKLRAAQQAAARAQAELQQKLATKEALLQVGMVEWVAHWPLPSMHGLLTVPYSCCHNACWPCCCCCSLHCCCCCGDHSCVLSHLQDTEDTLRGELLRRTHTILSMQAQIEQQDADLAAARSQQQVGSTAADTEGQDQEQAAVGLAAGACAASSSRDQDSMQGTAAAAAGLHGEALQLSESADARDRSHKRDTSSNADPTKGGIQHTDCDTAADTCDVELQLDVTSSSSSRPGSPSKQQQQQRCRPRPVSPPPPGRQRHPSLQLGTQQQQQQERQGDVVGSENPATLEHLSSQLAAAQLQLARCRWVAGEEC